MQSNLPHNVVATQYAVRGALVLRANELEKQLKNDPLFRARNSFDRITYCNIGNPQELGQQPITFFRQVISLVENKQLINHARAAHYPNDAVARAENFLDNIPGGTGAYSGSKGLDIIRNDVAAFIARRDGMGEGYADINNIYLSDGASPSVQRWLQMLIRPGANDAIMIPIPQYPLYSATITLLGGHQAPYYLDEDRGWAMDVSELDRAYEEAKQAGQNVRAIAVINPGNPTGQCLTPENMREIIEFAHRKRVVILADEVYQENVYIKEDRPFVSFKKAKHDMGAAFADVQLISFHSVSKGFLGECGKRGGYAEVEGIDDDVLEQYYKLASINLCPNIIGQLMVSLMVNPPRKGDPSWALYSAERDSIYDSLKRRAALVTSSLNGLPGITCNTAEGAMYAFPQITLPPGAIAAAKEKGMAPDLFYCMELLETTGVCVVPGSGFGQRPDTWHFRTTFLPREEHLEQVLGKFAQFHRQFLTKYRS
jgi:alanine transaminase